MFKYSVGQSLPNGAILRGVCLSENSTHYMILAEYGRQFVTWKSNAICETYAGHYFSSLHAAHSDFCTRLLSP